MLPRNWLKLPPGTPEPEACPPPPTPTTSFWPLSEGQKPGFVVKSELQEEDVILT